MTKQILLATLVVAATQAFAVEETRHVYFSVDLPKGASSANVRKMFPEYRIKIPVIDSAGNQQTLPLRLKRYECLAADTERWDYFIFDDSYNYFAIDKTVAFVRYTMRMKLGNIRRPLT